MSVRCRLGQATFAGTDRKWRDAPIAVIRGTAQIGGFDL
jgi:hypothetical protein